MTVFIVRLVCALLAGIVIAYLTKTKRFVIPFALVTMGAVLVCYISTEYLKQTSVFTISDPARLGAQAVIVVGFVGAGFFLTSNKGANADLSAAASLWASAIIGVLIGAGMMKVAFLAVAVVFLIFYFTEYLIDIIRKKSNTNTNSR